MPHVAIKMLKGRTQMQKEAAAEAVKEALQVALGIGDSHISVTVEEYSAEEWQDIFQQEITEKSDALYIKPQYDPKSLL